jgi:hypothetical protein
MPLLRELGELKRRLFSISIPLLPELAAVPNAHGTVIPGDVTLTGPVVPI